MIRMYLFRWWRHWQLDVGWRDRGWLSIGLDWRNGPRPILYLSPDATPQRATFKHQQADAVTDLSPVDRAPAPADVSFEYAASPSSSPVDAPSRPTGTPGPTVVASSVPTDTGTCRNCGGPVRYNLAVGWCAHIEARDFVACCDPWPARPGPDPSPECSTSHPAVHADCDGCTCTCHTDGES